MRCGACREPAAHYVYLADPLLGAVPGMRCRRHLLHQLLDGGHGIYRVRFIRPVEELHPLSERIPPS